MKYLAGLLLPLLFASNVFATNLCDSSCDLSITFPDGGSIAAVETFTITFGDGGFVNNGTVITGYSAGDILSIPAGESIDFQNNGSFELGGGNIDYSDILIMSNGVMDLAAIDGNRKVLIYDMTLLGSAALNISSDFEVVESGSFHIFSGPVTASTDLVFINYGSISGAFEFENAKLTLENETYDITGSVLIEADSQLTMTSKEVVIEPVPVSIITDDASASETNEASASGGFINLFGLLAVFLLLISRRFFSIIRSRKY